VQAVLTGNGNFAAALVLDELLADCRQRADALSASSRQGCAVLAGWDRSNRAEARGAHLFREWWRSAKEVKNLWRLPFNPEDAIVTPAGLRMDDPAVAQALYAALDAAVATVRAAGFALDAPLGEVQQRRVAGRAVPIPGGDEFEGVLNKVETQGSGQLGRGGYAVNYGSSYIQLVGFDDRGPLARGLLSYGQSSDPDSPWAYDQLGLLGASEWPLLPFHPADIEARRIAPPFVLTRKP
jgi:acyl-homoserine-lactone acylase